MGALMTADIPENNGFTNIPVGKFGIIAMRGTEEIAKKIDQYIVHWREENVNLDNNNSLNIEGYIKDSYLIDYYAPRFGTGEAKAVINETVRGSDIFILCDVFNYSVTYKMYGKEVPMSPDDHFCDLKRIICAISGKARRITVVMPMLYEGRQHRRAARESLDCAVALQELVSMGVDSIITLDAHDPRVGNSIPFNGLENINPIYQMIKAIVRTHPDIRFDADHLMCVSPDEGGMGRAINFATALGTELGMFYKRRDYTKIVDGRNPIIAHEFLGSNIEGKDIIVVDDMIASGDSMIEVASKLKDLGANKIYVCCSFGLFVNGLDVFDKAHEDGLIESVYTTNTIYQTPELLARPWYTSVEMSKFLAYILDSINHDVSISHLLSPAEKIKAILEKHEKYLEENEDTQIKFDL